MPGLDPRVLHQINIIWITSLFDKSLWLLSSSILYSYFKWHKVYNHFRLVLWQSIKPIQDKLLFGDRFMSAYAAWRSSISLLIKTFELFNVSTQDHLQIILFQHNRYHFIPLLFVRNLNPLLIVRDSSCLPSLHITILY